jgi:hypothetical protein
MPDNSILKQPLSLFFKIYHRLLNFLFIQNQYFAIITLIIMGVTNENETK